MEGDMIVITPPVTAKAAKVIADVKRRYNYAGETDDNKGWPVIDVPEGAEITIDGIWDGGHLSAHWQGNDFPASADEVEPGLYKRLWRKYSGPRIKCPDCEGGWRVDWPRVLYVLYLRRQESVGFDSADRAEAVPLARPERAAIRPDDQAGFDCAGSGQRWGELLRERASVVDRHGAVAGVPLRRSVRARWVRMAVASRGVQALRRADLNTSRCRGVLCIG